MAPQDSPNCGLDFAKRKDLDPQFARNSLLRMVIMDRVTNTLLGGLTLDPAGMHVLNGSMLLFSGLVKKIVTLRGRCAVRSGVHSSRKHFVAVYGPISTRFSIFFSNGLLFQVHYIVLIFVARWRHNFREIAVNNCEKSKNRPKRLCAPLRVDSRGILRIFHCSSLGLWM